MTSLYTRVHFTRTKSHHSARAYISRALNQITLRAYILRAVNQSFMTVWWNEVKLYEAANGNNTIKRTAITQTPSNPGSHFIFLLCWLKFHFYWQTNHFPFTACLHSLKANEIQCLWYQVATKIKQKKSPSISFSVNTPYFSLQKAYRKSLSHWFPLNVTWPQRISDLWRHNGVCCNLRHVFDFNMWFMTS